jgi:hypothetical protein
MALRIPLSFARATQKVGNEASKRTPGHREASRDIGKLALLQLGLRCVARPCKVTLPPFKKRAVRLFLIAAMSGLPLFGDYLADSIFGCGDDLANPDGSTSSAAVSGETIAAPGLDAAGFVLTVNPESPVDIQWNAQLEAFTSDVLNYSQPFAEATALAGTMTLNLSSSSSANTIVSQQVTSIALDTVDGQDGGGCSLGNETQITFI